jgi:hypothetical protein
MAPSAYSAMSTYVNMTCILLLIYDMYPSPHRYMAPSAYSAMSTYQPGNPGMYEEEDTCHMRRRIHVI